MCINKTNYINLHPKLSFLNEKNEWINLLNESNNVEELPIEYKLKFSNPICLSKVKFDEINEMDYLQLNSIKNVNLFRHLLEYFEVNFF